MLGQDVSGGGHTMPPSSSGFQNGQLRPDVWQQAQALINTAPVGLRPANVGIKALEVYISRQYVDQKALERHDGVSEGKYTAGLGQVAMSVCEEWEDVVSMSLTAVANLLRKFKVSPSEVGRLEVGTETPVDRSKSVKSHLIPLFARSGNKGLPGTDCINACYGGTQALLNAADWVESASWDGRLALVVAADVALYAPGPARPTGGCGAVAMLIGPDAPLALERQNIAHHVDHVYDFYKPAGLHPVVDGKLSVTAYLGALAGSYEALHLKSRLMAQRVRASAARSQDAAHSAESNGADPDSSTPQPAANGQHGPGADAPVGMSNIDFCLMHSPFCKMVRKGFAWLAYIDAELRRTSSDGTDSDAAPACTPPHPPPHAPANGHATAPNGPGSMHGQPHDDHAAEDAASPRHTFSPALAEDKGFTQGIVARSEKAFAAKVQPGMLAARECGNMYTASLYGALASLVESQGRGLEGKRLLLFSYGSGAMASMFCIRGRRVEGKFSLQQLQSQVQVLGRLQSREEISPAKFSAIMDLHQQRYCASDFIPAWPGELPPGTYHLKAVDDHFRRFYACS